MKSIITGIALFAAATAGAQQNRLSLGMTYFGQQKLSFTEPTLQVEEQKSDVLRYLPTLGYYRMLNASFGLGIELGYGRSRESRTEEFPNFSFQQTNRIETKYSEYYICPGVLELFQPANRNYRFIATLGLPISFSPDVSSETHIGYRDFSNDFSALMTNPVGNRLSLGLLASGAIQRRIIAGLYLSPQIGIGATYTRFRMDGTQVFINLQGAPNRSEKQITETQSDYRFDFRPSLALNYYF